MKRDGRLTPRKKPTQARSRATVEVILEAAAQVFVEKGYPETTTNTIAERAGVSIGSLYQYFPGKEAVLYSLMERHIRDAYEFIFTETQEIRRQQAVTTGLIRRLVQHMVDLHKKEPELHRVLSEEVRLLHFEGDYRRNEGLAVRHLTDLLERTAHCRKQNRSAAASWAVRAMETLTHRFVLDEYDGAREAEFVEEVTDMVSRYLLGE